jgi:hypothetical protein
MDIRRVLYILGCRIGTPCSWWSAEAHAKATIKPTYNDFFRNVRVKPPAFRTALQGVKKVFLKSLGYYAVLGKAVYDTTQTKYTQCHLGGPTLISTRSTSSIPLNTWGYVAKHPFAHEFSSSFPLLMHENDLLRLRIQLSTSAEYPDRIRVHAADIANIPKYCVYRFQMKSLYNKHPIPFLKISFVFNSYL